MQWILCRSTSTPLDEYYAKIQMILVSLHVYAASSNVRIGLNRCCSKYILDLRNFTSVFTPYLLDSIVVLSSAFLFATQFLCVAVGCEHYYFTHVSGAQVGLFLSRKIQCTSSSVSTATCIEQTDICVFILIWMKVMNHFPKPSLGIKHQGKEGCERSRERRRVIVITDWK